MRFQLHLPVVFSWRDGNGAVRGGEGFSRDVSSGGIYVQSHTAPPVGTAIELNAFLPQIQGQTRSAEFHAKGRVVRIDTFNAQAEFGFASVNHTNVLREAGYGARATAPAAEEIADQIGHEPVRATPRSARSRHKANRNSAAV